MSLIICPDCENQISDAAPVCVHCGRPNMARAPGAREHRAESARRAAGDRKLVYRSARMRRFLLRATSALTLLLCVACATTGHRHNPAGVDSLEPGVSTIEDAQALIGRPSAETNYADGSRLLQWQFIHGTPFGASGSHLAVLFDADGKFVRVVHRWRQ
jgi:hypothetical protein